MYVCSAFNKVPDIFVKAFKIVLDSWKFTMLLLYILWDDWLIFMISPSNEQSTAAVGIHPTKAWLSTAGEFQKCNLDMRTL